MRGTLWPAVAVFVIGAFMLVAGIGPLFLPILVILVGIALFVVTNRKRTPLRLGRSRHVISPSSQSRRRDDAVGCSRRTYSVASIGRLSGVSG